MKDTHFANFIDGLVGDGDVFNNFLTAIRNGKNEVLHNTVSQVVLLEDTWVLTLEDAFVSVEEIVRNPRRFITEDNQVVDVEKARKVSTKTVRNLASHSQYVRNIEKNGDVRPNKLLVTFLEEDIGIYENRFVCALVNRLTQFVEQRYRELEKKMDISQLTNVALKSDFDMGDSKFKLDLKLQIKEPHDDDLGVKKSKDLFDRVDKIRRRLRILQTTPFMKELNGVKPVRPPIQKTNLLMKNVDYHNCYNLWLFLSSYSNIGYSVYVNDKNLPFDGDYYDDLTYLAGLSLKNMFDRNILNREKFEQIPAGEPSDRDYNIVTNYNYIPTFEDNKEQVGPEAINEYYFRRMRDEIVKISTENDIVVERNMLVNFNKFFRTVSRINDEMFNDLIEKQADDSFGEEELSEYGKKQVEVLRQREIVRRREMLTKLKWEELERMQRMEERAKAKLSRMEKSLSAASTEENPSKPKKKIVKKTTVVLNTVDEQSDGTNNKDKN